MPTSPPALLPLLLDRWAMHRRDVQEAVAAVPPGPGRCQAEIEGSLIGPAPDELRDIADIEQRCIAIVHHLAVIRLLGARTPLPPLEALAAIDRAEEAERVVLERIRRAACPYCTDIDGFCCYPDYGVAPHTHDLEAAGGFLGSTRVLPRADWPPNFKEDPQAPGCGVYEYCLHCGAGRKNGPKSDTEKGEDGARAGIGPGSFGDPVPAASGAPAA